MHCTPQRNVILFQGALDKSLPDSLTTFFNEQYEFTLAPYDIVAIQIDGLDDASLSAFTLNATRLGGGRPYDRGTLVNKYGDIDFPFVGKIRLSGLTLLQAADTIESKLLLYYTDSSLVNVNVKLLNFPVTVIGEVGSPGVYQADNEFMTITELLAKAGNLTQFSNRKNIKLIRSDRQTQQTTVYRLDLTKAYLVQPFLARLQPNDVLYIEPTRRKQLQSGTVILGVITSLVSLVFIVERLANANLF